MEANDPPRVSVALALVVLSWSAWVMFQTTQLVGERHALQQAKVNQEAAFQQASKNRAQIDSIAADTARLAAQGNAGAQLIVAELHKRGITINPEARTIPPGSK